MRNETIIITESITKEERIAQIYAKKKLFVNKLYDPLKKTQQN